MGSRGRKSAAELSIAKPALRLVEPPTPAKAPEHLSKAMREWWAGVVRDYSLEAHHLRLLEAACTAWDRMTAAREAIAEHGITFTDKNGDPRTRPEVAIERDARLSFARLVRELDLDCEPPPERRPPALRSNRR